ncbi:putative serum response factor-binding protein 1 [Apostichopus japonicus]|uniref:Putative serum response factor-binding protein 1 n=1 Tax=Stichopus japonicus TaxID=307972 RepID=A0A2G8JQZ1_STIJA|nr:putative serum response factor-binding protein 1 [Apostichopus japonicus]
MDKVQFNNEVVIMRKTVKKVKVQVVKNLTRQIKQLRNKKGKPEELEKNKRRCDRLVEVMQAMKRWVPDDVTYSALMKTGTTNECMQAGEDLLPDPPAYCP